MAPFVPRLKLKVPSPTSELIPKAHCDLSLTVDVSVSGVPNSKPPLKVVGSDSGL